jgi:hypothetical protein
MNLLLEKQHIKNEIDSVNDIHLIKAIKEMLSYAKANQEERFLKPFTQQQLIKRALASEKDIENSKTTSLKNLRKEVKSW